MSKSILEKKLKYNSDRTASKTYAVRLNSAKTNIELLKIMQYYSLNIGELESNYNTFSKLIGNVR